MKLPLLISFLLIVPAVCHLQPKANFGASNTKGCGALQVVFIDSSAVVSGSPIVSWKWNLSGVISEKQNPGKIYDKPGKYEVCLTVTNQDGQSDTKCIKDFIIIYEKPVPNFIIDKNQGCSPLTVNFTDLSKSGNGKIVEWLWDIGGSANVIKTSDGQAVISSTYNFAGLNSMSLMIRDEKNCEATVNKKDILLVDAVPKLALSKKFLNSCELPWLVSLENANVDNGATYKWDFGNGQFHNGPTPPIISFKEKGNYDLKVIVQKGDCVDTIKLPAYVNTNPIKKIETVKEEYCLGEVIEFNDISELGADSVKWFFGDGTFSVERNPSHVYQDLGCYKVSLFRWRGNCKDSLYVNCMNINDATKPNINIDNQFTCTVPVDIKVDGLSSGSYNWTLEGPSMQQNSDLDQPKFKINSFGSYILTYIYKNEKGCNYTDSSVIEIKKFEANLPTNFIGGCIPYQVSLGDSNISEVPIISYDWRIGNPPIFTSNSKNPKFTLNTVGSYEVQLIVKNTYGCIDTIKKSNYVQGGIPPIVDFIAAPLDECLNVERSFSDNSSSNANFWVWDFGDMTTAIGKNVAHTYGKPGLYDVTLFAAHNGCASSKTIQKLIKVLAPVSSFKVDYQCDKPNTVKLNNLTIGADSLYWEIFDGNKRDTIRDSILTEYTFPGRGKYSIQIYSKNFATGCEHVSIDSINITDPIAAYTIDDARGCVPHTINLKSQATDAVYSKFVNENGDSLSAETVVFSTAGKFKPPMLLVKDIHGCADSIISDSIIYVNKIEAKFTYPDIICVPQFAEIINTSLDSFSQINSLTWVINADTFSNIDSVRYNIVNAGMNDIKLIVKDHWSCTDSLSIQGIDGVLLNTNFASDTFGCTNSDILFIPSGDNINTNRYLWEFSDGKIDSNQIVRHRFPEGVFDVCLTLFDIRGCENKKCKEDWVEIKDPVANFTGDPLTEVCPPLLTKFTNTSVNGLSFVWDFGDKSGLSFVSDPSHVYTEPDTFDVSLIVIRSESCRDTMIRKDFVKVQGPKGKLTYTIDGNCTPLTVNFAASSDDFYRYYWDYGNGIVDSTDIISKEDFKSFSYAVPGVYTPKLIISDNNGCIRNFSTEEIMVNQLDLNVQSNVQPLCGLPAHFEFLNLSESTSEATYYRWILSSVNSDSLKFSGTDIKGSINNYGVFDLLLIGSTDNCTDSINVKKYVEVNHKPSADFIISDPTICENNIVKIVNASTITSGFIKENIWTIDSNKYQPVNDEFKINGNGTKTIQLVAISDKMCHDTIEKTIEVLANPSPFIVADTLICNGDSANLIAILNAVPISFTWTNGSEIICNNCAEVEVKPDVTTLYKFTVNHPGGCSISDSLLVTVVDEQAPVIDLALDTILCKNIKSTLTVTNFNPDYNYEWVGISPIECMDDCKSVSITPSIEQFLTVIVKNKYGCSGSDSILVKIEDEVPDFLLSEKHICQNNETTLTVQGINVVNWSNGGLNICANCDSIIVNPNATSLYHVLVESTNRCLYKDSILVNVIPLSTLEAGGDKEICRGETIELAGIGFGNASWSMNDSILANTLLAKSTPNQTTHIKLTCSKDECTLSDSLLVTVITSADIEGLGDTICFGDEVDVTASGLANRYQWYYNGKLMNEGAHFNFSPDSSMLLNVIGSRTTCISDTQEVFVKVHPEIAYKLAEDEYLLYYNSQSRIKANYKDHSYYSYSWTPAIGLSCNDCPLPLIKDITISQYYVLTVIDENTGCEISLDVRADLREECSREGYYIPNVVYTNGSGGNNTFFMRAANPEEFISIVVVDRWGNKVFGSKDINFTWDFNLNIDKLETGVYTYIVHAICPETNNDFYFGGDVTLLK